MTRMFAGLFILVLAWPVLAGDDKPKADKPATPAEEYAQLEKDYDQAFKAYRKASAAAKTAEDRHKVFAEMYPADPFAGKFLALAEKYPDDPVALDALIWIGRQTRNGDGNSPLRQSFGSIARKIC